MRTHEERLARRSARAWALSVTLSYGVVCTLWLGLSNLGADALKHHPAGSLVVQYGEWGLALLSTLFVYVLSFRLLVTRTRGELAHTESERALATLIGHLPGLAYRCAYDFTRTMTFVSGGSESLTGYGPEALKDNREVSYAALVHPEDQPIVARGIHEAVASGQPFRATYRIRTAGGEEKWVMEQGCAINDLNGEPAFLEGIIIDITTEKRYERELEAHQATLEARVQARTADLTEANAKLTSEIEERRRLEQQLREMSTRDALTGLYNRREMDRFLKEELDRCQRYERHLAVVMLDIDHFKQINDTHGHQVGDDVIRWLSGHVKRNIRSTDRAIRYGGEEVALILPETPLENAFLMADRLRSTLSDAGVDVVLPDGRTLHLDVTLSAGVAAFPNAAHTGELLIAAADQALYEAKRSGRNRTVRYQSTGKLIKSPTPVQRPKH
ncbi:MAG: diguanylate cyclase [Bradymonadia bacterium]